MQAIAKGDLFSKKRMKDLVVLEPIVLEPFMFKPPILEVNNLADSSFPARRTWSDHPVAVALLAFRTVSNGAEASDRIESLNHPFSPPILSPMIFNVLILSPFVLGPNILSPGLMVPYILTPYVLSPNILNPFLLSPV